MSLEKDLQASSAQERTDGVDADLLVAVFGCEAFGGLWTLLVNSHFWMAVEVKG